MTMSDSYHKVCLKKSSHFLVDFRNVVNNKVTHLKAKYPVAGQYLRESVTWCREVARVHIIFIKAINRGPGL